MSKLNIESTNGGSKKVKIVAGQTVIDPEQNELIVPPDASKEARCSDIEEDYITYKLVGIEKEMEKKTQEKVI